VAFSPTAGYSDRPVTVPLIDREVSAACGRARATVARLASLSRADKDAALRAIAAGLLAERGAILDANRADHEMAVAAGTAEAMLDRLRLDDARVEAMSRAVLDLADLDDPVGQVIETRARPNGLSVTRVRVPLGLIAMIYEARPNVTAESAALTLKAGNAVTLRGGSEALRSNVAIHASIARALATSGLPEDAVTLLASTDRDSIRALVQTETVDLAIPRGGEGLIRFVTEHARVPVVQHYKGVCHLYVDAGADPEMAVRLAVNGKLSRPGVCNALECLLVDRADAAWLLPSIARALLDGGCELRGDDASRAIVREIHPASDDDFGREFLSKVMAVRVVDGVDGALSHIARYGSGHTEVICTNDEGRASRFQRGADAACVMVNASSRFHDGGELGLGAELGIATSRLHWRGPMGLEALTTMKWLVQGDGQIRR